MLKLPYLGQFELISRYFWVPRSVEARKLVYWHLNEPNLAEKAKSLILAIFDLPDLSLRSELGVPIVPTRTCLGGEFINKI